MSGVPFPYFSMALDVFGLIIVLIIFASCLGERIRQKNGSKYFTLLLTFTIITLTSDICGWIGEGRPSLAFLTLIANTVASCSCFLAILCFLGYLKESLYGTSKAVSVTVAILAVLCVFAILFLVGNIFHRYAFTINEEGHYVRCDNVLVMALYMPFPLLSFFAVILMSLFAQKTTPVNRFAFIIYTLFPAAGLILDYLCHGFSMTYIGFVISVVMIYTSIYLQKQKIIDAQRNALMMSQINPHFMYNTLSTIAAMCECSPHEAKDLTLEFSRYLRQNINSLTSETLIPLETEMKHVECYLKIEKARFRENLNVIYNIRCKDFLVPPLSVQPIVENAVRHGITKKPGGGTVKITAYSTARSYVIMVTDDGAGFDTEAHPDTDRPHVGLENVKSRIGQMCRGELTVKSTPGIGTRVTMEIPKKKGRRYEHLSS